MAMSVTRNVASKQLGGKGYSYHIKPQAFAETQIRIDVPVCFPYVLMYLSCEQDEQICRRQPGPAQIVFDTELGIQVD